MRVTFRVELDDGTTAERRRFVLTVDQVPYPQVPRAGEYVVLPARNDPDHNLQARKVWRVVYAPDGTVLLDVRTDALTNDPGPQVDALLQAGYEQM